MTGKRKMISGAIVLVLVTLLLWFGKLNGDQYVEVLSWLFMAFGLANGAEHIGKGMRNAG